MKTIAALLATAAVTLMSVTPTFAHDYYDRHARDHAKHRQFHGGVAALLRLLMNPEGVVETSVSSTPLTC